MRRGRRWLGGAALVVVLVSTASGCVQTREAGGKLLYTYEWWVAAAAVLAATAAAAVGWLLCDLEGGPWSTLLGGKHMGYGLLIGGPLLLVLAIPGFFTHYVRLDDEHFEVRHGWWFAPDHHNLTFEDLDRIDLGEERHVTRRGVHSTFYFDCVSKSGRHERVQLDRLTREALEEILSRAEKHGVITPDLVEDD